MEERGVGGRVVREEEDNEEEEEDEEKEEGVKGCRRPKIGEKRFVRVADEAWAQERYEKGSSKEGQLKFPFKSHRLRSSWIEKRFDHLDEEGIPKKMRLAIEEEEQNYDEPAKLSDNVLKDCEELHEKGELTKEELEDLRGETWFEQELLIAVEMPEMEKYKEIMKTPAQMRRERGIDEHLTSQVPRQRTRSRAQVEKAREKKHQRKIRIANKREELSKLKSEGYSRAALLRTVVPKAGSKSQKVKVNIKKMGWEKIKQKLKVRRQMLKKKGLKDKEKTSAIKDEGHEDQHPYIVNCFCAFLCYASLCF